jgi:cysteine synthase A
MPPDDPVTVGAGSGVTLVVDPLAGIVADAAVVEDGAVVVALPVFLLEPQAATPMPSKMSVAATGTICPGGRTDRRPSRIRPDASRSITFSVIALVQRASRRVGPVMARIPTNIAAHVGSTPMVQLTRIAPDLEVELFAKLEAFNPGGSVKDRIGVAMIESAERQGQIEPGVTTIVEATSGNTGIALAFVCAAKGYELVLTMPQGMSREREGLLRLYGAAVEVTESLGGMNEAVDAARQLATRDDVFLPDQFTNPANPEIHRRTTGPEIWDALDGRVDVFVVGVGTGGTITGAGEVLKARNPACRVVAVEPRTSAVLSGGLPGPHKIQGIGAGFVPAVLNREVLDEVIAVDDEDAIATARELARREGVLAGISGGAAVWAAVAVARRPESRGARIVTILPDSGERYVSTPFFAP